MGKDIVCALTGELISALDVDALAEHWEFLQAQAKCIQAARGQVAHALMALCPPGVRTTRAVGVHRVVKLEAPDQTWDQKALKELWAVGGRWSQELLRVDRVAVNKMEVKKYEDASGGDCELADFLGHLKSARREPVGQLPAITVEKL